MMERGKLGVVLPIDPASGAAALKAGSPARADTEDASDLRTQLSQARLVIERDGENGRWIYKAVDLSTGEVLSQIPILSIWDFLRLRRNGVICDFRA